MRKTICFAAALAVLATVSAHADEQSAKWVGRWLAGGQYTATPEILTLKETGGKITGDFGGRPIGIAMFKGDRLRTKFQDAFGTRFDCTLALKNSDTEFAGDCFTFHNGHDEKQTFTGTRQK